MSETETFEVEMFDAVSKVTERRRKLIQRVVIKRMKRRGMIDDNVAKDLETKDWQDFLEWILENGPSIIEFIMSLIALFGI